MTREDLWDIWGPKDLFTFAEKAHKKDFYEDLEAWYETRHTTELNAIKQELLKSLKELDNVVEAATQNRT